MKPAAAPKVSVNIADPSQTADSWGKDAFLVLNTKKLIVGDSLSVGEYKFVCIKKKGNECMFKISKE